MARAPSYHYQLLRGAEQALDDLSRTELAEVILVRHPRVTAASDYLEGLEGVASAADFVTAHVKVVADATTDELLGVHMIGAGVTDLIAEASAAMLLEATAWEVGSAVHPHPTLSEALGEAALAVDGKSINF